MRRDDAPTGSWIRSKQRPDGSWATYFGGPGDLSTTVEAYVALRLAGDPPDAAHMRRAAAFVRDAGGVERSRVFTRMWLSLLSLWSWKDVPTLPPEQILLPPARAALDLRLRLLGAADDRRAAGRHGAAAGDAASPSGSTSCCTGAARTAADTWGGLRSCSTAAALLRAAADRPAAPPRARRAERWIVERQERDGSWGGIQPPWVWSMIALHALGYALDHPVLKLALAGLDSFTIDDEDGRRLEACQSPVWDTALAVIALLDAGLPADHPAIVRAAELARGPRGADARRLGRPQAEARRPAASRSSSRTRTTPTSTTPPSSCSRCADSGVGRSRVRPRHRVDARDADRRTAAGAHSTSTTRAARREAAVLRLRRRHRPAERRRHRARARDAGYRATRARLNTRPARAGLEWLLREQERDGSWFGRWGANYVYGTGAVLPALAACGLAGHPGVARAVDWLDRVQNPSGGFGEDLRSYRDDAWRGRGASTASQTAWALIGLHAAGEAGPPSERAVGWLVDTQRSNGGWDEPLLHRHRLSRATSTSTTTSTGTSSR